jgi:hypothetical protein
LFEQSGSEWFTSIEVVNAFGADIGELKRWLRGIQICGLRDADAAVSVCPKLFRDIVSFKGKMRGLEILDQLLDYKGGIQVRFIIFNIIFLICSVIVIVLVR